MLIGCVALAIAYLRADYLLVDLEKRTALHVVGWLLLWPLALLLAWMRGRRHG